MARRLMYFARPILLTASGLRGGEPMPFLSAQDAEDGGRLVAKMAYGAVAYQQLADPEFDIWEDPELLAVFGDVSASVVLADVA